MSGTEPMEQARATLQAVHPALIELSHRIHANPQVGYEETLASGWLADALESGGFEPEMSTTAKEG